MTESTAAHPNPGSARLESSPRAMPPHHRRRLRPTSLLALFFASAACQVAGHAADAAASAPRASARPTIATIAIPGDPRFVAIARDVMAVQAEVAPDFAAQAGLVDDALHVPSFAPARVASLVLRLRQDMARLRALPWRRWSVDAQIDVRWTYANAERIDRELAVERLYLHRPGAWLETLANDYVALLTYAPDRGDAFVSLSAGVPAMVDEMAARCTPTQVDVEVAQGLIKGLVALLRHRPSAASEAAIAALSSYGERIAALRGARTMAVLGRANYAWRLKHAMLLPWGPDALDAMARRRQVEVDRQIAALAPSVPASGPLPPALEQAAQHLDQASLLALYDHIQLDYRDGIERAGFVTIPAGVGPVRARVTPDAMVPLTGDGGSMNPPPPFLADDTGWWNVEHFDPKATLAEREEMVREAALFRDTDMGPYAAHEGLPGHHLQLAIARLHPDPIRSLFQDAVQNEGWALYAEQEMWEQGGLGDGVAAHVETLKSWRYRIRRVVYDVNVETGRWTLQQAADWKHEKPKGRGTIDADLRRTINWPAQLVCYFAGKEQILDLKARYRRLMGAAYSERRFHD